MNKYCNRILIILIFIFAGISISGQTTSLNKDPEKMFPAWDAGISNYLSSDVGTLGTYGAVPTTLFTGTPDITVPLHELILSDIVIPITLKYHIHNVKPNVHPGIVGLGWNLFCGGNITRIQKGNCDEFPSYGFLDSNFKSLSDNWSDFYSSKGIRDFGSSPIQGLWSSERRMVIDGYLKSKYGYEAIDTSSDEYSFNFLGYSGSFYLDHTGKWVVDSDTEFKIEYELITYDKTRPQISKHVSKFNQTTTYHKFKLTAPDGTIFIFGGINAINYSLSNYIDQTPLTPTIFNLPVATTWHLSEIISTKGNSVEFEYTVLDPIIETNLNFQIQDNFLYPGTIGMCNFQLVMPASLKSIKSNIYGELISLNYEQSTELKYPTLFCQKERGWNDIMAFDLTKDPKLLYINSYSDIKWNQLASLNIKTGDINTNYKFTYTNSEKERLKLIKLEKIHGMSSSSISYEFQYNKQLMPDYLSGYYDFLGFNNGEDFSYLFDYSFYARTKQADAEMKDRADLFYKKRKPDTTGKYLFAEMLEKIAYPTKGYTKFEYEPNYIKGSLSIGRQSIEQNPMYSGGLRIKRISNYTEYDKFSSATSYYYVHNFDPVTKTGTPSGIMSFTPSYYHLIDFYVLDIDGYGDKIQCFNSESTNIGWSNSLGSMIGYSEVIECQESEKGEIEGYTRSVFTNFDTDIWGTSHFDLPPINFLNNKLQKQIPYIPGCPYSSKEKERGKLTLKEVFNKNNDKVKGNYYKYKYISSRYPLSPLEDYVRAIDIRTCPLVYLSDTQSQRYAFGGSYNKYAYSYLLDSEEEVLFNKDIVESSSIKQFYEYTNLKFLSSQITWDSQSQKIETKYKYLADFISKDAIPDNSPLKVYKVMQNKNMLNYLIEKTVTRNDLTLSASIQTYQYTNYNQVVPSVFYELESNRLISDYKSITMTDAFNLSIDPRCLPMINSYQYDAYGNPIYITLRNNSKVVYLWGYKGQYPIAEIQNATYQDVNTALQKLPESLSTAPEPDMDLINGLREKLTKAQVSTYTHYPLIGIKTSTDPRKILTKYDYDWTGRLRTIYLTEDGRDKIIKRYEYQLPGYVGLRGGEYIDPKPEPIDPKPEPELTPDPYKKGKESSVLINIGAKGDGSYGLTGWNYDTQSVKSNNVITKTYKTIEASEYQWTTENLRLKYGTYASINMNWVNLTQADVDKFANEYLNGQKIPLEEFEQIFGTWVTLYDVAMMYRNIYWGVPIPGTNQYDHTWGLPTKEDIWQLYGQAPRTSGNVFEDIKDFLFASACDNKYNWTQNMFNRRNISGLTLTPLGMRESNQGGAIYGFGQVASLQTSEWAKIETLADRDLSGNSGIISNPYSYHFTQARHRRLLTDEELGYKMYIDAAKDSVLMLPHTQVSSLTELPKGLERGIALRYANREHMKVLKKWSEIQAEATEIKSKLKPTNSPAPPALLPCGPEPEIEITPDPYEKGQTGEMTLWVASADPNYGLYAYDYDNNKEMGQYDGSWKTYPTIGIGEFEVTTKNLTLHYRDKFSVAMGWVNNSQTIINQMNQEYNGTDNIDLGTFIDINGTYVTLYNEASSYQKAFKVYNKARTTQLSGWDLISSADFLQMMGQAPVKEGDDIFKNVMNFLGANQSDVPATYKADWFEYKNASGFTMTPLGRRHSNLDGVMLNGKNQKWIGYKVESGIRLKDYPTGMILFSRLNGISISNNLYHFCQARYSRAKTDQELGYKMYIDVAKDAVVMLPYDKVSTLPELPKGVERGVALRYANRKYLKVVKKWSEIQAEAAKIKNIITGL